MFHALHSTVRVRGTGFRFRVILALLSLVFVMGAVTATIAQDAAEIEPGAGSWTTWVLDSGSQFRVGAPPDAAGTADEISQLMEMASQRDEAALQQIDYWNAGPPAYRWNQIALDELTLRAMPHTSAIRNLALLHVAIYDATIAAWDSKYAHNRPRPSEVDAALTTAIPNPASPSYPSEYAVTAGASAAVLGWLFPDKAQVFDELAQQAVNSRLLAGVEYPSDVEAGLALGRQVAELVIERGNADGSTAAWAGTIPTGSGMWTGENPASVTAGTWATWVLTSPDQFRPAPPPAFDSEQMAAEMAEVKSFERTPITSSAAMFWEFGAGGRRNYWFWNDVASRLILEARLDDNPPMAARAYALVNIANYDSVVACFDAKYTYWSMRPFQIDTEFAPLFATPNHPSYPSAHSCISAASAGVLANLFPTSTGRVTALAYEAGESRIWGGIHFRSDINAGIKLGEDVAGAVLQHAASDGAE